MVDCPVNMRNNELSGLGVEELRKKVVDLRKQLLAYRIQRGAGSLESPVRLRLLRRDIARCLTVISAQG